MQLKKQKVIQIILMMFLLSLPALAFAHGLVPCGGEGENPCKVEDIFVLIARVTNWLLMMAGAFAVFKMVNAAFWLTAAMGNEEKITYNRKAISNAVVGFCLAMMAFMIINSVANVFLLRGIPDCKIDLQNPMTYLKIDEAKQKECKAKHQQIKQQ